MAIRIVQEVGSMFLFANFLREWLLIYPLQSAKMSEKSAIVVCCLFIAVLTIPILVVVQTLSTLVWSGTMIVALIKGEGVFEDEDKFYRK